MDAKYLPKEYIPSKSEFKKEAKRLKEFKGIKSTTAHELLAKSYGFKTYNAYLRSQS